MRGKRDFESRLDDLVQQRDRSSVSGEPVRLELGIPRRTKEILQGVGIVLGRSGSTEHAAKSLLRDDDVAVRGRGPAMKSTTGQVREAFAVSKRRALLGHLVDEHGPGAQRSGEPRASANLTRPGGLGAQVPRRGRLSGPLQAYGPAENLGDRPFDVRCNGRRAAMHEHHARRHQRTAGAGSRHGTPPQLDGPPSPAPVVVVRAVIVTYEADVALLDSPVAASRRLEEHDGPQDIAAAHGRERFLDVA